MFFEHPQVHFCRVYVARGFPFFLQTAREKKETKLKMHRDKWMGTRAALNMNFNNSVHVFKCDIGLKESSLIMFTAALHTA